MTIQGAFDSYIGAVYKGSLGSAQVREVRQAFFAGALAAATGALGGDQTVRETIEETMRFARDVEAGRGGS